MKEIGHLLSEAKLRQKVEVLSNTKNISLVVEATLGGQIIECLYRPEKGLRLTLDPRIPKPEEIYRDSAYTRIDRLLGWNVSMPVEPWSLDKSDNGVISPFIRAGKPFAPYVLSEKLQQDRDFALKLATLDYICAVTDRTANDILETDSGLKVIDSGLSFVKGSNFVSQSTVARDVVKGSELTNDIVNDLQKLDENLEKVTDGLLDPEFLSWVHSRKDKLVYRRVIV